MSKKELSKMRFFCANSKILLNAAKVVLSREINGSLSNYVIRLTVILIPYHKVCNKRKHGLSIISRDCNERDQRF